MKTPPRIVALGLLYIACSAVAAPGKQLERLDRGVVAIHTDAGNFVSWRALAPEPAGTTFNLYRDALRLNGKPLAATNFVDAGAAAGASYTVRAVQDGVESAAASPAARSWDQPYLRVPLHKPAGGVTPDGQPFSYVVNDGSAADLDGDSAYELLVKWQPTNAHDNSQRGYTGPTLLDAYRLDGTLLWRIDLGPNIRAGAHYTTFLAYDFDGDGRAELMMKTADGSIDGQGKVIGKSGVDHRNAAGYVLSGPEYLTVFDGRSGAALASTAYLPARGAPAAWGDAYGNRVDRFLGGVAYLDGVRPSAVFTRGYYTRAVLAAWDWRDGKLTQRWLFDSDAPGNGAAAGQGAHWMAVADVDGDGRDDIVYGAATIAHDGRLLYSTGLCHGDALHVGHLDPKLPGRQVFMVHETPSCYRGHGAEMHDAATGRVLWRVDGKGSDVGRGACMDIDAAHPGAECWASVGGLVSAAGVEISPQGPRSVNFGLWWDGDLLRESLDGTRIDKWNPQTLRLDPLLDGAPFGAASNNGTKATPVLSADLFGDWREEVVWRSAADDALLVFSTTLPTRYRMPTLMHDPQYRVQVAAQNAGYNQPPHPGFFLGDGMTPPPASTGTAPLRFAFGPAAAPEGYIRVAPGLPYAAARGYGFEDGGGQSGDAASYFSVDLPEGNYAVTLTLGAGTAASTTTVKSELRRLMLENVATAPGATQTRSFIVNVRTAQIAAAPGVDAGAVHLKVPRETEQEAWNWDRRLTLEFNGTPGAVQRLDIAPVRVPTLFLLGDSTVSDQPGEPYNSWGQMLPRFFGPGIAVANHAESGETYRDSLARRRIDKILSVMQPGDTVLMQFGHNDQKQIKDGRSGPFTSYKAEIRTHVERVRARGGLPVIVSPLERRAFDDSGNFRATLLDYAEAARQSARELGVPFIDLNAMSRTLYDALDAQGSAAAFASPAPGRLDNTHHNSYGSYLLAKTVVLGMIQAGIPAAAHALPGFHFDPAHPDPVAGFAVPASPHRAQERPLGDEGNKEVRSASAQ